ncbi:MAG: cyclase family protein [Chloroflexales bacterium]|nr:cyclase family protein [Chloroflexales bacterium]
MLILSEIAKPGSRRVSLEGIGLLGIQYYQAERSLREVAEGAEALQNKWRLSGDELYHVLATLLNEIRLKRALAHPIDQMPRDLFYGAGICIDLSHKEPHSYISADDLDVAAANADLRRGDVLLLYIGVFNRFYGMPAYLN